MSFSLEVKTNLPQLGPKARKLASAVVRKTAFDVEAHAKVNAPKDLGALANSIYTVTGSDSNYPERSAEARAANPGVNILPQTAKPESDLEAVVAVGVNYGLPVELGTEKAAAQPYLGPAVEAVRPGFERAAAVVVRRAVEE